MKIDKMTEREAIEMIIENYPKGGVISNHYTKVMEALDLALNALEKRIGRKPKTVELIESHERIYWNVCDKCGLEVESDFEYCSECGQRIDWSEEE